MNHNIIHCADFDKKLCPWCCRRGEVVLDLERNNRMNDRNIKWGHFKNTDECWAIDKKHD